LAVTMVKIHDRQQRIQLAPQTCFNHDYPVICSGTTPEIQGPELINRWVRVIKKQSGEE